MTEMLNCFALVTADFKNSVAVYALAIVTIVTSNYDYKLLTFTVG